MRLFGLLSVLGSQFVSFVAARWGPAGFEDASDLHHFVTRPELKPPRYYVKNHDPAAITPGHLFVSPYSSWTLLEDFDREEHLPCQAGPAIYDSDGELVWSGACQFFNHHAFDFKPVVIDGTVHMSFVNMKTDHYVLNKHYEIVSQWQDWSTDLHEYAILSPEGHDALTGFAWNEPWRDNLTLHSTGFARWNLSTRSKVFEWNPLEHGVTGEETSSSAQDMMNNGTLDFFHLNSVDLNAEGDYLVSARYPSTLYKISGQDGHLIWRLSNTNRSDFTLNPGAEFQFQHDARFHLTNSTHTIVSLFDNGAVAECNDTPEPNTLTSTKFLSLDTSSTPMTATLIRNFSRPDGGITGKTGGAVLLGDSWADSHVLTNWACGGYISEHDASNRLIFEARFRSERFNTYRAYKSYKVPFVGLPLEPPVMKIVGMDAREQGVMSALYVSWNGATEVRSWAFYGSDGENGTFELLDTVPKKGFETSVLLSGRVAYGYVEARDVDGVVLNRSKTVGFDDLAAFGDMLLPNLVVPSGSSSVKGWVGWSLIWNVLASVGLFTFGREIYQRAVPGLYRRLLSRRSGTQSYGAIPTSENSIDLDSHKRNGS